MNRTPTIRRCAVTLFAAMSLAAPALAGDDEGTSFKAKLRGFNEVPAVSTVAKGRFLANITGGDSAIEYELSYSNMEAPVTFAHIHLGQRGVAGGIIAFLCGGGKPACPSPGGTVTGTIVAADVVGPAGQGIAPGEFAEALRAVRAGVVYANVHSEKFPPGEIRGQLRDDD